MASKRNPASGESLMILLGVGIVGYFAYINNWLAGLGLPYTTAVAAPATTPVTSATAAAVSGTPALGTPVTSNSQIAMQVSANYPYIIPLTASSGQQPGGYSMAADTNTSEAPTGQLWLRNDVASAVLAWINANNANGPATIGTLFTFPVTLSQVQSAMGTAGLHGLGFVRGRSMYPFNPISAGVGILNAPRGWN